MFQAKKTWEGAGRDVLLGGNQMSNHQQELPATVQLRSAVQVLLVWAPLAES